VEGFLRLAPAGTIDEDIETAEFFDQRLKMRGEVWSGGVEAFGDDVIGILELKAVKQFLAPAGGADEVAFFCVEPGEFTAYAAGSSYDEDLFQMMIFLN